MFQEDPDFIQYLQLTEWLSKTDAHESASDVGVDLSTSVPDQSPITATLVPGTLPLILCWQTNGWKARKLSEASKLRSQHLALKDNLQTSGAVPVVYLQDTERGGPAVAQGGHVGVGSGTVLISEFLRLPARTLVSLQVDKKFPRIPPILECPVPALV